MLGHRRMKQNGNDTARYGITSNASSVVEKVATAQLNREGVAVIWLLHLSATQAHFDGYANAASSCLRSPMPPSACGSGGCRTKSMDDDDSAGAAQKRVVDWEQMDVNEKLDELLRRLEKLVTTVDACVTRWETEFSGIDRRLCSVEAVASAVNALMAALRNAAREGSSPVDVHELGSPRS
jgi:hypothetical protein